MNELKRITAVAMLPLVPTRRVWIKVEEIK
jgi:hypothetical protein